MGVAEVARLALTQGKKTKTTSSLGQPTGIQYTLACQWYTLASPRYILACPRYILACPRYILACPRYIQGCSRYILACRRYILACHRYILRTVLVVLVRFALSVFVDDTGLFLRRSYMLQEALDTLSDFHRLSGLKVQEKKSVGIWLNTTRTETSYADIPFRMYIS